MTDIVFSSEVMLLGWRETHSGGATVTFLLADPSDLEPFKRMTVAKGKVAGQRMACVLAQVDDETGGHIATADESTQMREWDKPNGVIFYDPKNGVPQKPSPNELARKLMASGYFRSAKLWLAMHDSWIYTAQDHYQFLAGQDCVFADQREVRMGPCGGDVCTHHCNAASTVDGGKRQPEAPQKPLHFWGLPICHNHHTWAHNSTGASREDKEWLFHWAVAFTAAEMKEQMKRAMGIASLREITKDMLAEFEQRIGL